MIRIAVVGSARRAGRRASDVGSLFVLAERDQ